jgi:hypothetical protein
VVFDRSSPSDGAASARGSGSPIQLVSGPGTADFLSENLQIQVNLLDAAVAARRPFHRSQATAREVPQCHPHPRRLAIEVPKIVANCSTRPLVDHDGHFSGHGTAKGEEMEPSESTLRRLADVTPAGITVVIDYLRILGSGLAGFPQLDAITKAARAVPDRSNPRWPGLDCRRSSRKRWLNNDPCQRCLVRVMTAETTGFGFDDSLRANYLLGVCSRVNVTRWICSAVVV